MLLRKKAHQVNHRVTAARCVYTILLWQLLSNAMENISLSVMHLSMCAMCLQLHRGSSPSLLVRKLLHCASPAPLLSPLSCAVRKLNLFPSSWTHWTATMQSRVCRWFAIWNGLPTTLRQLPVGHSASFFTTPKTDLFDQGWGVLLSIQS